MRGRSALNDGTTAVIGLLVAVGAAVAATSIARRKHRGRTWGVLSFLFPPTLLLLLLMPSRHTGELSPEWEDASSPPLPFGTHVTTEHYQRGFFGKLVAFVFWGWQVVMVLWAVSYLSEVGQLYRTGSDAERAGTAIGGTLGISVILWVWVIGAVILGLMMFFTRGQKVITTQSL
jgi:hypothetical protein